MALHSSCYHRAPLGQSSPAVDTTWRQDVGKLDRVLALAHPHFLLSQATNSGVWASQGPRDAPGASGLGSQSRQVCKKQRSQPCPHLGKAQATKNGKGVAGHLPQSGSAMGRGRGGVGGQRQASAAPASRPHGHLHTHAHPCLLCVHSRAQNTCQAWR